MSNQVSTKKHRHRSHNLKSNLSMISVNTGNQSSLKLQQKSKHLLHSINRILSKAKKSVNDGDIKKA